jgi:hypothetical protein
MSEPRRKRVRLRFNDQSVFILTCTSVLFSTFVSGHRFLRLRGISRSSDLYYLLEDKPIRADNLTDFDIFTEPV